MVLFDLDGTITRKDTYLGLLLYSLRFNPRRVLKLPALFWPTLLFKLKRIDNTALKKKFLRALLAGVPDQRLREITRSYLDRLCVSGLRRQALDALHKHQKLQHETVLLSASLDFYVIDIAERLQFDHCICTNTARRADGSLSGELIGDNCYGMEKLSRVKEKYHEELGRIHFIAYADHPSDMPLLQQAQQAFAINPGERMKSHAKNSELQIVYWD